MSRPQRPCSTDNNVPKGPPFRFRSPVHAVALRDYLMQNGVPAQVVGGNTDAWVPWVRSSGPYEVVLGSKADAKLAAYLVEQFNSEPAEYESGLDDQALPDLSRLDPEMAPPCAACGEILPLDATLERCPSCDAPVDVAERIVDLHGPEALAPCYESSPSTDELMAMQLAAEPCASCGGPIDEAGACSWCGRRR